VRLAALHCCKHACSAGCMPDAFVTIHAKSGDKQLRYLVQLLCSALLQLHLCGNCGGSKSIAESPGASAAVTAAVSCKLHGAAAAAAVLSCKPQCRHIRRYPRWSTR
jgi:hypothetical protein